MIVVQDVLISEDILEEQFHCNLDACKGACCWEGDYGAPLKPSEMDTIHNLLPVIQNYLSDESNRLIDEDKAFTFYKEPGVWGTSCLSDGSCVFLTKNELGIAMCSIEKAYRDGISDFQKPVSCHLYPIRVSQNEIAGFEAWNYDRWDICNAACQLGKQKKLPVYQFVKEAIIRLKGEDFYKELDAAYNALYREE